MAAAPQIPPGVNLSDNRGPAIIRISVAVTIVTIFFVAARLISRRMKKAALTLSDYLAVLSLVGCILFAALDVYDAKKGLGKHVFIIPLDTIEKIFLSVFVQEIIYTLTLVCIKISILLLYTGIFPAKSFGLLAKLVGLFVILWGIAVLLAAIFSCIPVDAFWNIDKQPTAKCINQRNFFIGNSVPNIIADAIILTLPINQVWHLNMSRRSKVGVSVMFALGGFVVIASCVRMAFLLSISVEDPTWTYYGIGVWTAIELDVATISACLPTLRPILVFATGSVTRLYGSNKSTKASDQNSREGFPYKKQNSGREYGEEFQRLPDDPLASHGDHDMEMQRQHKYRTNRSPSSQKLMHTTGNAV